MDKVRALRRICPPPWSPEIVFIVFVRLLDVRLSDIRFRPWFSSYVLCLIILCLRSIIRLIGVFDDEAGAEFGYGVGEAGEFDAVADFVEVFVGIGGFVFRVVAAIC